MRVVRLGELHVQENHRDGLRLQLCNRIVKAARAKKARKLWCAREAIGQRIKKLDVVVDAQHREWLDRRRVCWRHDVSLTSAMGPMAQNPMFKGMAKLTEEMKKIQGFPLARTTEIQMMGKTTTSSSEAIEVKQGPVPASAFDIPAGYKLVDSPRAKMGSKK